MYDIAQELLLPFFTGLGVVLGASIVGSLAALFTLRSPLATMNELARAVKFWAVMLAIGGTFPMIRVIETGVFQGQFMAVVRQLLVFISGFLGAYSGYWIIITLTGGE